MSELRIGDKVRKIARRGHRGSGVLGVVIDLFLVRGRTWARIASGKEQKVNTAWPVKRLARFEEEEI